MRYLVHLRRKDVGQIDIEAESQYDAAQKVKRMIVRRELPAHAIKESTGLVVTYTEPI